MVKETQAQWVQRQLETFGFVTRNKALKHYISRLASRIADLRRAGMQITAVRIPSKHGTGDYKYFLVK